MTKLPLPSPRSPSELDKKILAYAKQQIPEKKPYRPPLWLSGMATASVIAIAIFIAIPDQPPTLLPTPRSAVMEKPAKVEMLMQQSARKQSAPVAASAALYAEQEMAASDSMQMPMPLLDTVTIQQHLQEMDSLLKRGDSKQAALKYQEMKKHCPHCDLPATVEQAIEKYLAGD